MLAIGPITVHHMAARGDLPGGIKFGRNTYRWRRSVVVGWIAAQQPGPACASGPPAT
jgi:hypothetical protein